MEGIFRGTWYRSEVKLEGETIVPVPPFERYNPFDWYFSATEVRQGERSLYLDFLDVNSKKPEEVLKFCQRFGVLGDPYQAKPRQIHRILERVQQDFKKPFHEMDSDQRKRIQMDYEFGVNPEGCQVDELCLPLTISDFGYKQFRFHSLLEGHPIIDSDFQKKFKQGKIPPNTPVPINWSQKGPLSDENDVRRFFINHSLTESGVMPSMKWNIQENRWELSWLSYSLFGYLALMYMLDKLGVGKILSCPRCQKFFVTASNRTKFCSPSCQGIFKVQKYQREKKKKELAAQAGKKSKATKPTGKNK